MEQDKKKYSNMENVLQYLNKKHVSLQETMKKQYNIYQVVVFAIIEKMKETNPLFKILYRELFYGGSYYDGLKISKPEEYDLDLLMKLPDYAKPELTPSDLPGFVRVQLTDFEKFKNQPEYKAYYTELPNLLDADHYLDAAKVKVWMESLINKTLNKFEQSDDQRFITCEELQSEDKRFFIKMRKGGPAFTLNITSSEITMDVDLVPCFVFTNKWPTHCNFKENPCPKDNKFFIVPKAPKGKPSDNLVNRCWRMSFQIQERELIRGKANLKPALKLMKKLRDHQNNKSISSYFLKTILIFQTSVRDDMFWSSNLATVFVEMLKVYDAYLEKKNIPYYWNEEHNMIGHIGDIQLENIRNKVKKIIGAIERCYETDPFIAASFLVNAEDLEQMKQDVSLGKKATAACLANGPGDVLSPLTVLNGKQAEAKVLKRANSLGVQPVSENKNALATSRIELQLELIIKRMDTLCDNQDQMLFKMGEICDRLSIVERKVTDNQRSVLLSADVHDLLVANHLQ